MQNVTLGHTKRHFSVGKFLTRSISENFHRLYDNDHIDGLVQDCSNSIANALELLQSGTKPSIYIVSISITVPIFIFVLSICRCRTSWLTTYRMTSPSHWQCSSSSSLRTRACCIWSATSWLMKPVPVTTGWVPATYGNQTAITGFIILIPCCVNKQHP